MFITVRRRRAREKIERKGWREDCSGGSLRKILLLPSFLSDRKLFWGKFLVFGNLIDCELNSCNGDRGECAEGWMRKLRTRRWWNLYRQSWCHATLHCKHSEYYYRPAPRRVFLLTSWFWFLLDMDMYFVFGYNLSLGPYLCVSVILIKELRHFHLRLPSILSNVILKRGEDFTVFSVRFWFFFIWRTCAVNIPGLRHSYLVF